MTITRAMVEGTLIARAKKRMEFVGMNITSDGENPDLSDPISAALMQMGIMPVNISSPTSTDIALVALDDIYKLMDIAELRLLENILGNNDKVTLQAASGTEQFGQFTQDLEKLIARKQASIQRTYGIGLGATVSGARKIA